MQGKAADWRRRTAATKTKAARQTLAGQAGGCWTDGDGRTTGIRTTGVRTHISILPTEEFISITKRAKEEFPYNLSDVVYPSPLLLVYENT